MSAEQSALEASCKLAVESPNTAMHLTVVLECLQQSPQLVQNAWSSHLFPVAILQILTDAFYILGTDAFGPAESDSVRVCLDILQIAAGIPSIKDTLLSAKIDCYIYPFLLCSSSVPLCISALEFFRTILAAGMPESMKGSELLPLLLKVADSGPEASQRLALEVLSLIFTGNGLEYAVQTVDRFQAIDVVLGSMVTRAIYAGQAALLKSLLKIYGQLCEKLNVRQKLAEKMPEGLDSEEMLQICAEDKEIGAMRSEFLTKVNFS